MAARRVQRGHHDVAQVAAGAALGFTTSSIWYHYSYLLIPYPDSRMSNHPTLSQPTLSQLAYLLVEQREREREILNTL
jgi:hypothetical protein